jgi:hypothetical protein
VPASAGIVVPTAGSVAPLSKAGNALPRTLTGWVCKVEGLVEPPM